MEENLKQQQTNIIKVALFGPESTGKTTLAKQLAQHFNTAWVSEFARDYLQKKWDETQTVCQPEDLIPIAVGQTKLENDALNDAKTFLFCDTNLLVTKAYSEIYYGFCNPILDKAAKKHKYDLIFLTAIDVPWEKDDLRDKPTEREAVFEKFKSVLIENNKPFIVLSGNKEDRLQKAISIVNNLKKAIELGFSAHDFVQIYKQEISLEDIESQLNIFRNGIPKIQLIKPATIKNGILSLSESEFENLAALYDREKVNFKLEKLVPASGAATRMFQFLSEFLNNFTIEDDTINAYINKNNASELQVFLAGMEKFPFFKTIDNQLNKIYSDFKNWDRDRKNYYFIKHLIATEYLDFANKPKGVLPFHQYQNYITTPIEEHLTESVFYASANGVTNLHFTISESHRNAFETIINEVRSKIEMLSNLKITINFSYQNKETDTIAVDLENKPFRDDNGKLVFRPGGHGALIENLNCLDADVIFIKNIDNVIQDNIKSIGLYKKALAGILLQLQKQIFEYLIAIEKRLIDEDNIESIIEFVKNKLNISIIDDFEKFTFEYKLSYLFEHLNRPIRICGMVKNEGEPGGGPFWVKDSNGTVSLQIVESSQVEKNDTKQAEILANSTHFNPVDLVCGTKNYKSEKFNLTKFIDHNSGFIVDKTNKGKALKAYELPGLWNGAMAKWTTIFVEVPLITFNPVKTVNDLLKAAHQK